MVAHKLLDAARAVSLMATSRRSDLENGSKAIFPDRPLFTTPPRRHAAKAFSRTFSTPQASLIAAFVLCMYIIISSHRATGPNGLEALLPRGRSSFGLEDSALLAGGRPSTLVIYDYQGLDEEDLDNLRYFLALGVNSDDGNRYIIIVQEKLLHVEDDDDQDGNGAIEDEDLGLSDEIPLPPLEGLPSNAEIIARPNGPCRSSWGVLGWLLYADVLDMSVFQNFILVDSSVRGPFLPAHWPPVVHWSAALLPRLQGTVHMVGATILTDPTHPGPNAPVAALTRVQPRVCSGLVAFDHIALQAIQRDPDALKCRADVGDAAWFNEAGASAAVLHSGLNLDCLMLRYQNKDWLDKSSWGWKESNSDVDSGPFQVMFVPLRSKTLASSRAAIAAHQYSMWAIKALRAAASSGDNDAIAKPIKKASKMKKTTATDTATARMQLDAAAAQAAAMALWQQREKAAELEEEEEEEEEGEALLSYTENDNYNDNQLRFNNVDNELSGAHSALDDFEDDGIDGDDDDYTPTDNLGDFTDDFEGMNAGDKDTFNGGRVKDSLATAATTIATRRRRKNGQILPRNRIQLKSRILSDDDDYLRGDDVDSVGDSANDSGDALLKESEDEYRDRAQQWEENPFGDGDDVEGGLNDAAARAGGVA